MDDGCFLLVIHEAIIANCSDLIKYMDASMLAPSSRRVCLKVKGSTQACIMQTYLDALSAENDGHANKEEEEQSNTEIR